MITKGGIDMTIEFDFEEIEPLETLLCDCIIAGNDCEWFFSQVSDERVEFFLRCKNNIIFRMDCIDYKTHKVMILNSNTELSYSNLLLALFFLTTKLNERYYWYIQEIKNLMKKYTGSFLEIDEEDYPHQKTLNNDSACELFTFLNSSYNR